MESYHIKPNELDPFCYNLERFERFNLNTIYIPDRRVLVGFIDLKFPKGKIINYNSLVYINRAESILRRNRGDVKGEVIQKIDLKPEIVDQIAKFGERYHNSEISITKPFDGSTERLIQIISGELRPKGVLGFLDNLGEAVLVFDIDSQRNYVGSHSGF